VWTKQLSVKCQELLILNRLLLYRSTHHTDRVPTGLLSLDSRTSQVVEWQFPWPYRNNNPITQMLQYIPRFIIAMKHVIYGALLNAARGVGECCKLPQRGMGRSPSANRIWCILARKSHIWWHQFFIFPDFSKKFWAITAVCARHSTRPSLWIIMYLISHKLKYEVK